ncbi:MAG: twin-arginine translocase TatA/TatE family subunit [Candidatus Aminicenantes bacterium]|nr:twin-arginine translocase TatA/TatE family subunit [Candidatus Aminicenantes bacterium]
MFLLGPLGPGELILIVLLIVIIFGARKLPELGKSLGQGIKNFKKSITSEENNEEEKKPLKDKNKSSSKD